MCHTVHFNPIGVTGEKKIVNKQKINVDGGPMECEVQKRVHKKGKELCDICLQITGRGIHHKCRSNVIRSEKIGRARSTHRENAIRRKQNYPCWLGKKKPLLRNRLFQVLF